MKCLILKSAALLTCGSILLTACQKPAQESNECKTTMATLAGSYKLTALTYKLSSTATGIDYLAFMDACERDDIITLRANGTYSYQDAGLVCNPDQNDEGTWQLSGDGLISDGFMSGKISSFDCKTLVFFTENTNVDGDRLTFTMVRQ